MARIVFRSVKQNPPMRIDLLSYAAQGRAAPPSKDPDFAHKWRGLSVFDSYRACRENAANFKWRMGEFIAELHIPDEAPLTYEGPDYRGHLNLYDGDGGMLRDEDADHLLRWVVRVVHGPSTRE